MKQELTKGNSASKCRAFLLNNSVIRHFRESKFVISGFCCEVSENCTLVGYYAVSNGNFLPTFWDNLSFPFSAFKNLKENAVDPNIGCVLDS